ncbi:MAG: hypothetical protein E2O52_10100 [Gammaproteobacteria bacterium]|nr:MAG: hypothetical protein E2O52_10100 [Gammaproteobacteria bacterium]
MAASMQPGRADMHRRCFLLATASLTVFGSATTARAHHKLGRKECHAIKQKMQKLQSRLRRGTSARQGRKIHAQMRELQLRRFRGC